MNQNVLKIIQRIENAFGKNVEYPQLFVFELQREKKSIL